jgi:hypothetical protein
LADDDGGESGLTYTWSSSGPGILRFATNGTNAAKSTTATADAPGTYTIMLVVTDRAGHQTSAILSITISAPAAEEPSHVYVRRARIRIAAGPQAPGRARDRLTLTGYINPAGLPASLAGTTVHLEIGEREVVAAVLDDRGRYRRDGRPRRLLTLSSRSGRFRVRIAGDDLQGVLGNAVTVTAVVPVRLVVTGESELDTRNHLAFALRATAKTIVGRFRAPANALLDGAFLSLRTKMVPRGGGMVVRARGVVIEAGGQPIVPTGDIAVTIGDEAPLVIPFSALHVRGGSGPAAILAYRGKTGIRRFVLANGRGSFAFVTSPLPESGAIHAAADGASCHAEVPIRLEVPTADGVRAFSTEVEVIERPPGSHHWVRPARPCAS